MTDPTVAAVGLGAMGLPMATRLAETLPVRAYDVAAARRELAAAAGLTLAASPADAARGADVILLVVRDQAQVDASLFDPDGVLAGATAGAVVILTSTVGAEAIPATAARLAERGVGLVDAPLSGGPVRAGKGDLLIVVGAAPADLAKAQPVLDRLASTLSIVGDQPGDGQKFKTVNQLLCGVHIAAAAEALALADALGLDVAKTHEALAAGAAGSFMLGDRGKRMLQAYTDEGPQVLSRLDIFVKDMGIVTAAARQVHLAVPVAAAAQQLYLLGEAQGKGAQDDSTVIQVVAPNPR
jgi:3-hydroxyisobutyrate dehydrogenase